MADQQLTQGRLFDLDSPLHGKVRGERSIMDFPFFSLAKRPDMKPVKYEMEGATIEIRPSASGIATMYDKEIILYVASLMVERREKGLAAETTFTFNTFDFFRVTGVARPSKRDYDRFSEALGRLQGTQIRTNIKTGETGTRGWFSWFAQAHSTTRNLPGGGEQLLHVKVQLCDWLYRAIERDARIYNYHHDYFRLGPIERRLYEVAHCFCEGEEYEMPLETLAQKFGAKTATRRLKSLLKEIQTDNRLPEYEIAVREVLPAVPQLDSRGRKKGKPETIVALIPRDRGRTAAAPRLTN
jgi:plasmid replication initiation protein